MKTKEEIEAKLKYSEDEFIKAWQLFKKTKDPEDMDVFLMWDVEVRMLKWVLSDD